MRRHLLSAALALTLVVGLTACDAEPLAAPSQSPSPTASVSWSERRVADEVTLTVPEGRTRLSREDSGSSSELTIAQAAPGWENIPGIFTVHSIPDALMEGPDYDVSAYRDRIRGDYEKQGGFTDTSLLPDRTVGDSPAYGFTGTFHSRGGSHPCDMWAVWREDGMWRIYVCGFEGDTTIPPELLDALDTLQRHAPATTSAPTSAPQDTAPSPTPSPSH